LTWIIKITGRHIFYGEIAVFIRFASAYGHFQQGLPAGKSFFGFLEQHYPGVINRCFRLLVCHLAFDMKGRDIDIESELGLVRHGDFAVFRLVAQNIVAARP